MAYDYDMGEYKPMFEQIMKQTGASEQEMFKELMRGLEARGVSPAAVIQEGAKKIRATTARQQAMAGAKLAGRAGSERFRAAEAGKGREAALKRLRIGEAGAAERLKRQLEAAEERMKWQWEQKKTFAERQAREQRKAGYAQLGISTALGALTGGLAPQLFGKGVSRWGGAGLGALTGASGMAGIAGGRAGYSMQADSMMDIMKRYLDLTENKEHSSVFGVDDIGFKV